MYLLITISILALALMWVVVRGRSAQVKDPGAAEPILSAVDLQAFRNLIDVGQDRFLRQHLPTHDYRRVQRARALAAAAYLRKAAHNASIMLRVAESARDSGDPALSVLGADMVTTALRVRVNCLLALGQAYAAALFPYRPISIGSVADSYDRLAGKLRDVGRAWTVMPRPNRAV